MPLKIIRNDITTMRADAIVNPTNRILLPTGGTDAAVHRAAGSRLREACRRIGHLAPGKAAITEGFDLPCRYVIHTVGPGRTNREGQDREVLASCYRESLTLAMLKGCKTVAVPLIASGLPGLSKDQALFIAVEEIRAFLRSHDLDVTLVVHEQRAFRISRELYRDVKAYIDDRYVAGPPGDTLSIRLPEEWEAIEGDNKCTNFHRPTDPDTAPFAAAPVVGEASEWNEITAPLPPLPDEGIYVCEDSFEPLSAPISAKGLPEKQRMAKRNLSLKRPVGSSVSMEELDRAIRQKDEGFSQMLLRKIDESGMKDSDCYKKAGIDRKLFSKIRSDPMYRPSKLTALAFAIALELPLSQTKELLEKAGFALSHSNKSDIIVEYFIRNGIYDLYAINEALFAFDQALIGG